MPQQGVVSMFNYGKGVGRVQGVVLALGLDLIEVRPQVWKRAILPCIEKGKAEAIRYIKFQFPEIELVLPGCKKPHDGLADAACIAVYGGLHHE